MKNAFRQLSSRPLSLLMCVLAAAGSAKIASAADNPIKGIWARNAKECADREGANSRTFIDLENRQNGKLAPLVDRYENHCKVLRSARDGQSYRLDLKCYEFWELYEKDEDGSAAVMTIKVLGANSLQIDGARHVRCKR